MVSTFLINGRRIFMKKYLFLLITTLLSIPTVVFAATDLSQEDFDLAKEILEYYYVSLLKQSPHLSSLISALYAGYAAKLLINV